MSDIQGLDTVRVNDELYKNDSETTQSNKRTIMMSYWAISSAIFMLYIGAAMGVAYGTRDAIIGLVLTIVSYSIINAVLTKYSLNHRVTVARLSRTILGKSGTVIAAIILALTAIYYSVFEGLIVVHAFQTAFGGGPIWAWSLLVVVASTPLILGGIREFLGRFNGWLLPLYIIGLITVVVWAGVEYGYTNTWLTQAPETALPLAEGGPGWLATFAAYMGVWVLLMYAMDYAAEGKRKDIRFHVRVTFTWPFWTLTYGVNALAGIFLTFTIPGVDASETGLAGGMVTMMGALGLLLVVVFQVRINTANYYISAINMQEFGNRIFRVNLPMIIWALVCSAIIFLMMLLPIIEYLSVALAWQGVLVTGWIAIALTHMLFNRSRKEEHGLLGDEHYSQFNVPGIIAWAAATAVGLVLMLMFPWGATWGPIATVVVASGLYAVLRVVLRQGTALKVDPKTGFTPDADHTVAHPQKA